MHELSIVTHVAKTLEELAEENHLAKIGSVTLKIGEVSGIMTDYFTECWDYFKRKHPLPLPSVRSVSRNMKRSAMAGPAPTVAVKGRFLSPATNASSKK